MEPDLPDSARHSRLPRSIRQLTPPHTPAATSSYGLDRPRTRRVARRATPGRTPRSTRKLSSRRSGAATANGRADSTARSGGTLHRRNLAAKSPVLPQSLRPRRIPPANPPTRRSRLRPFPPAPRWLPTLPRQYQRSPGTVLQTGTAPGTPPAILRIVRRTPAGPGTPSAVITLRQPAGQTHTSRRQRNSSG